MPPLTDPREAYRRNQFDARVHGSDPGDLVQLCIEQVIAGVGGAIIAHDRRDPAARSRNLTRALSALTALEMGVDHTAPLAEPLLHLYGAARKAVLACVSDFQPGRLADLRRDFEEIGAALRNAQ